MKNEAHVNLLTGPLFSLIFGNTNNIIQNN